MTDVGARKIDVVVVYKVDRLTRFLPDFARIVEAFDKTDARLSLSFQSDFHGIIAGSGILAEPLSSRLSSA